MLPVITVALSLKNSLSHLFYNICKIDLINICFLNNSYVLVFVCVCIALLLKLRAILVEITFRAFLFEFTLALMYYICTLESVCVKLLLLKLLSFAFRFFNDTVLLKLFIKRIVMNRTYSEVVVGCGSEMVRSTNCERYCRFGKVC